VTIRPVGTITDLDTVRLEVQVNTAYWPATHEQPPEVANEGNDILIRMWVVGGPSPAPDSLTEVFELGTLAPGTYRYAAP